VNNYVTIIQYYNYGSVVAKEKWLTYFPLHYYASVGWKEKVIEVVRDWRCDLFKQIEGHVDDMFGDEAKDSEELEWEKKDEEDEA